MNGGDREPLRVCVVGCGAVTQAIHLPVLALLGELFRLVAVVDPDLDLARTVGAGARAYSTLAAALAVGGFDVVAVCSPAHFHEQQVIEACAARVRGILCEKPLALGGAEAGRILRASEESGVPVVVATMHAHDPAFTAAREAWEDVGPARLVESICFLPSNEHYLALATELRLPSASRTAKRLPPLSPIHGLASHHLGIVEDLMGGVGEVISARQVEPYGYEVVLSVDSAVGHLVGVAGAGGSPEWRLRAVSDDGILDVAFPPSYVQAGSAHASLTTLQGVHSWSFDESGYEHEWRALRRAVDDPSAAIGDLRRAAAHVELAERIVARSERPWR